MLSHVIEHIYRPAEFLRDVLRCMNPSGQLIVVTPNCDSFVAKLTGKQWVMLRPVDHVSMLSAATYEHLGLDGVTARHSYDEYHFEFLASILASLRDAVRSTRRESTEHGPAVLSTPTLKSSLIRAGLSAASFPFWALGRITNRQACLTTVLTK
jgi:hypothetical protein